MIFTTPITIKAIGHKVATSIDDRILKVLSRATTPIKIIMAGIIMWCWQLHLPWPPQVAQLLLAMLEKRVGFHLIGDDVFVNIAGGLEIDEPAADLGVVASVASSYKNRPVDPHTAVFGEVGLSGEVRHVPQAEKRLAEAKKLGFAGAIGPKQRGGRKLPGLHGVNDVRGALNQFLEKD